MIYGFQDTGRALCIEFYGHKPQTSDDRQYCLLERDWRCPPQKTSVTCQKQKERVFIKVDGHDDQNGAIVRFFYYYELTPEPRLEFLRRPFDSES